MADSEKRNLDGKWYFVFWKKKSENAGTGPLLLEPASVLQLPGAHSNAR